MVASMGNETVGSGALSNVDVDVGAVTSEVNKASVGDSCDKTVDVDVGAVTCEVNKVSVGDVGARSNKVTKRVDDVGKGGDSGDVGFDAGARSNKVNKNVDDVGEAGDAGGQVESCAGSVKSKETMHVNDVEEAGDSGAKEKTVETSVVNGVADSGVNVETDIGALRNSVVMNVGVVDEACNLRDKVESDLRDKSKDCDNETDSSSTSGSSSPGSTPARTSDSLRSRAMRILSRGAMPLCPPARRLWTRNLEIEVNERKFMWPPTNWRALTADSRLLAMEQMALILERGESEDFPRISRKTLVDKYAFLMLDGQAKPTIENTESEKVPDKIRQYHLSYLKGLIKGDIGDSRTAWSIVKTLDHSDRWLDTDEIIDMLDAGGVKIKI